MAGRCGYLSHAIRVMESIASLKLAGKWDNVGLLIDTLAVHRAGTPYTVLFTNDLTPKVMEEAIAANARLVITYHPTPFSALKQFRAENPTAKIILECARNEIAVFAPHTSLDAVPGGLNDWLIDGIVGPAASRKPIKPSEDTVAAATGAGDGRIASFAGEGVVLSEVIARVKQHLSLTHVQVALPSTMLATTADGATAVASAATALLVSSVAVCAGSGSSVLAGVKADVLVTGEMSHHEILAANHAGTVVILTHHSKCERGFLPVLIGRFEATFRTLALADAQQENVNGARVHPDDLVTVISRVDADPLVIL